jgi:hypothetical protein
MNKDEFDKMLSEALKENMTVEFSFRNSYGYGRKVLMVHVKYKNETIAMEEVDLS